MYTQNTDQPNNTYEEKNQYLPRFKKLWNPVTVVGSLLFFDAAATLGFVDVAAYNALSSQKYDTATKTEILASSNIIRHGCGLEAILGLGFVVGGVALTKKKEEEPELNE